MNNTFTPLEKGQENWHDKYNEDMQALHAQLTDFAGLSDQPVRLYVDGTGGSDSNDGSESAPFQTIQRAVKAVHGGVQQAYIWVQDGVYDEIVSVKGKNYINIFGWNAQESNVRVKSLVAEGTSYIRLTDMNFYGADYYQSSEPCQISFYGCHFRLDRCKLEMPEEGWGLVASVSAGMVIDCDFKNCRACVIAAASRIDMRSCTGSGNYTGLVAQSGVITKYNLESFEAEVPHQISHGGQILPQELEKRKLATTSIVSSENYDNYYCKDDANRVLISATYLLVETAKTFDVLATLPQGFRPEKRIERLAVYSTSETKAVGTVSIDPNGKITLLCVPEAPYNNAVYFEASFLAAN